MNNEIKEILYFKENADYKKLSCDEIVILKDYITNLQQRIEKAVEYIELRKQICEKQENITGTNILVELENILNGRSNKL